MARSGRPRGPGRPRTDEEAFDREAVVRAALSRFAEQGYEGTSLRELAESLGISHALLRHYFGSKHELWVECIDTSFGAMNRELYGQLTDLEQSESLLDSLRELIVRYVVLSAGRPENLLIVMKEGAAGGERLEYLLARYMRPFVEAGRVIIERAQAEGLLRRLPWQSLFFLVFTGGPSVFALSPMVRGLGAETASGEAAVLRHAEAIAELVLRGLGATEADALGDRRS